MSAAAEPTLDQRLRFIHLTCECLAEAKRRLIASGEVSRFDGYADEGPTERGRKIAALAIRLRNEAMAREGLPLSLIPDRQSMQEAA